MYIFYQNKADHIRFHPISSIGLIVGKNKLPKEGIFPWAVMTCGTRVTGCNMSEEKERRGNAACCHCESKGQDWIRKPLRLQLKMLPLH